MSKDDQYKAEPLNNLGCNLWQMFFSCNVYFMEMNADSHGLKGFRLLNVATFVDINLHNSAVFNCFFHSHVMLKIKIKTAFI